MKNPFLLTFSEKSLFITIQRKILFYYYSEKNPLLLLFREKSFRRTSFQRKVFREKSSEKNPLEKPPITLFPNSDLLLKLHLKPYHHIKRGDDVVCHMWWVESLVKSCRGLGPILGCFAFRLFFPLQSAPWNS